MDTLETTLNTLRRHRGEWPDIAKVTGLSYWWLVKVAQGKIKEPGAGKVDRLRDELATRDSGVRP